MKRLLPPLLVLIFFFEYCSGQPVAQGSKGVEPINEVIKNGQRVILYENSYALLVGVSQYEYWDDLKSIPGEMDLMESALIKHGFIVEKFLNPSSEKLYPIINNFINKYGFKEDNRLLIFFSGHGYTRKDGTKGYIVPADAADPEVDEIKFAQQAIEMDQVMTWAKRIESKHALFVFDSCFSGTIFKSKSTSAPAYISYLTGKPIRQFITAGSAGETVPAKSYFVPCFIRGIEGEADAYRDGYITATELGLFLQREIKNYNIGQTPQYGKIRDPDLDRGDFVFIGKKPISSTIPPNPPSIEYAEKDENKLFVFDTRGNRFVKRFDSQIMCYAIDDINQDGNNDILVGFDGKGKEHSRVIAFNAQFNKKWHYIKEPNYPYAGKYSGRFAVFDLKVFQEKNQKIIAVLFGDSPWYPSALIILSPEGEKLKELWHPGHMYQIERIKSFFIIRAVNNALRQTSLSKPPYRNFHVIFGLTYENIYGEAPPYFGNLKKNIHIRWYYLLSDQEERFEEMVVLNNKIRIPTRCGKIFYVNENGMLINTARADKYSCKESLQLLKLMIKMPTNDTN